MVTPNTNLTTATPPTNPTTTQETVDSSDTNASTARPLGRCKKGIITNAYTQWKMLFMSHIDKFNQCFTCIFVS